MDLDISDDVTEKLGVVWSDVIFLSEALSGKMGEFLIRSNGSLCHKTAEYEKVSESEVGMPDVVWDGTGYSKLITTNWTRVDYSGLLDVKTTILGKTSDADVELRFEIKNGYVASHDVVKLDVIDNAERKEHDRLIKKLAIERAQKMNTKTYQLYYSLVKRPLKFIVRLFGLLGSYIQDFSWKAEKKLNK
tara:strand:+ start:73960 stop:74529 length:570 start_codon:yes stop_codon:yes gene_type:complete